MNWRKQLNTAIVVRGIHLIKNGFYIINGGDSRLMKCRCDDGGIVKINKISKSGVGIWFNDRIQEGNSYSFNSYYKDSILREATLLEIKKWEEHYK